MERKSDANEKVPRPNTIPKQPVSETSDTSTCRFTRSHTYSLNLYSAGQPRYSLLTTQAKNIAIKPHPLPPTKPSSRALARKLHSRSAVIPRACSVPVSPISFSPPFSRSHSVGGPATGSRESAEGDKDSARRLIQNLVTIFSQTRSPSKAVELGTVKKEPIDLLSKEFVEAKTMEGVADLLSQSDNLVKREKSEEVCTVPAESLSDHDGIDSPHTFHTPVGSPLPGGVSVVSTEESATLAEAGEASSDQQEHLSISVREEQRNQFSCDHPAQVADGAEIKEQFEGNTILTSIQDSPRNTTACGELKDWSPSKHSHHSNMTSPVNTGEASNKAVSESLAICDLTSPLLVNTQSSSESCNEPKTLSDCDLSSSSISLAASVRRPPEETDQMVGFKQLSSSEYSDSPSSASAHSSSEDSTLDCELKEESGFEQEGTQEETDQQLRDCSRMNVSTLQAVESLFGSDTSGDQLVLSIPLYETKYAKSAVSTGNRSDIHAFEDKPRPLSTASNPQESGADQSSPPAENMDTPPTADSITQVPLTETNDIMSPKTISTYEQESHDCHVPVAPTTRESIESSVPNTSTSYLTFSSPIVGVVSSKPHVEEESESTLCTPSEEGLGPPPAKKRSKTSQKMAKRKKGKKEKARHLVAKAQRGTKKATRKQKKHDRAERRTRVGGEQKMKSSFKEDYSPPPAKKHCYGNSSPNRIQSKPVPKATPPKNTLLADILTNIPDVDICPLSAHKATPISSVSQKQIQSSSTKTRHQNTNSGQTTATEPSPSAAQPPMSSDSKSDHHKLLMRWEKDITLGSKTGSAPMLYANENLSHKLTEKGPWIEKAKMIWASWRRGTKPEVRDEYLKRAKRNRSRYGSRKMKSKNLANPEENDFEMDGTLLQSPLPVEQAGKKDVCNSLDREVVGRESTLPSSYDQAGLRQDTQVVKRASLLKLPLQYPSLSVCTSPIPSTSVTPLSRWGVNPLQIMSPAVVSLATTRSMTSASKQRSVSNMTPFNVTDILATPTQPPLPLSMPKCPPRQQPVSSCSVVTILSQPNESTAGVGNSTPGNGKKAVASWSITTQMPFTKQGPPHHTPLPDASLVSVGSTSPPASKVRKRVGLSSRLSPQTPLVSPTFVIPTLGQSSHKHHSASGSHGDKSINPRAGAVRSSPTSLPIRSSHSVSPYIPPSMLRLNSHVSSPLEFGTTFSGSTKSRSSSVSSLRSSTLSSSPGTPSILLPTGMGFKGNEMKTAESRNHPLNEVPSGVPNSTNTTPSSVSATPPLSSATPTSPLSPSGYYNSHQYRLSIWKKVHELNQIRPHKEAKKIENDEASLSYPTLHSTSPAPLTVEAGGSYTLSGEATPLVVQPAVPFNRDSDSATPPTTETTPLKIPSPVNDSVTADSTPSPIRPSLIVNGAYIGDFSSMSLWEMEQLYAFNKAALYRQKKITKMIKAQLIKLREEEKVNHDKKMSRSDLYKRFLHFLVEPKCTPSFDLVERFGFGKTSSKNILEEGLDRPVLKKELDKYGSLSAGETGLSIESDVPLDSNAI